MSKFHPTTGFKWIDPKEFDLSKYNDNSSRAYALEAYLKYPIKICELHDDYHIVPDKS